MFKAFAAWEFLLRLLCLQKEHGDRHPKLSILASQCIELGFDGREDRLLINGIHNFSLTFQKSRLR